MPATSSTNTPSAPPPPDRWANKPGATARAWPSEQMIRLLCRNVAPARRAGMTAVDVGCGNGRNSVALATMGFQRVIAVDPSPELAAAARAAAGRAAAAVDTLVGGLPALPLPDAAADVAVAWGVMYVVGAEDAVRAAMGEVRRVLRPGGVFISDWRAGTDDLIRFAGTAIDGRTYTLNERAPLGLGGFTYSFWNADGVRDVHEQAGFEILDMQREEIHDALGERCYAWWQVCASTCRP